MEYYRLEGGHRNAMNIKEQLSDLVETERVNKRVSVREFTGSDELDDLAEINDADDDDIEC